MGNYDGWDGVIGVLDDNGSMSTNSFDLAEAHVNVTEPTWNLPVTTTNDTVCYGNAAYLTATSTIDFPQHYIWYAPDARTILLRDTVDGVHKTKSALDAPYYYHYQDQTYYVAIGNDNNCPPVLETEETGWNATVMPYNLQDELTTAEVNVKISSVPEMAVNTKSDTVCYGSAATVSASADLQYPQYYTWYNKQMEVLKQDTLDAGETESVLNLPAHYANETYYAYVYSNTVSCIMDMDAMPKHYSELYLNTDMVGSPLSILPNKLIPT